MQLTRTALTVSVVAAFGLGAAACSGKAPVQGDAVTAAASASPSAPTTASAATYAHLSDEQINNALLTYGDMPQGYSVAPDSASAKEHTFCSYEQPTKAVATGTRSFNKGAGLSQQFASVTIREYASPAAARRSWDALKAALATCHEETYQGEKLKYALMSAPHVGGESVGVRMTVSDPAVGDMTVLKNFALVGPCLISSGAGGLLNVDADETAGLLRQQVAAYQDAAVR